MHRAVQSKRKKAAFFTYRRWAFVGAAAACLAVLAVSYALFLRPAGVLDAGPFQETAFVGLRKGGPSKHEALAEKRGGPRGKGEKKGPAVLRRLEVLIERPGSRLPETADLKGPLSKPVTLTAADNYGFILEPAVDLHVYVFQITASQVLVGLFPNEIYSSISNPMLDGQTYNLPSNENWLHLGEDTGEERIYIIASQRPLQDLTDLYARSKQGEDRPSRQKAHSRLLETLDTVAETHHGEVSVWVLPIDHQ
jgi:hypothetical protein